MEACRVGHDQGKSVSRTAKSGFVARGWVSISMKRFLGLMRSLSLRLLCFFFCFFLSGEVGRWLLSCRPALVG